MKNRNRINEDKTHESDVKNDSIVETRVSGDNYDARESDRASYHHDSHHKHHSHKSHSHRHHHKAHKNSKGNKWLKLIDSRTSKRVASVLSLYIVSIILLGLFVEFSISRMITQDLSEIVNLRAIVNEYAQELALLKNQTRDVTSIVEWDKPIYDANIPVFELPEEKPAMTDAEMTPDHIYEMYDALMAKHPQYITKTDLGLCSDGINHVYCYEFKEPDSRHTEGFQWSETKTKAIIVSGIHYEWAGIYGMYYALEEISNNPDLYGFRRNSHLIVIPCLNPFATIGDNYKLSQGVKNANGVEIHRNFEVDWKETDVNDKHYGGAEPLTEVESQYLDNIFKQNTDAALFLTCHSFADESYNFIWPSVATAYMCNMGYRLIDKMSNAWMAKYSDVLVGLDEYRTSEIESWDNRLGYAHISQTNGTETKQAIKYGIQGANVEICGSFWTHGTRSNPEAAMSSFTMSRGAEVYVNFLITAFGVYDPYDKLQYGYK